MPENVNGNGSDTVCVESSAAENTFVAPDAVLIAVYVPTGDERV